MLNVDLHCHSNVSDGLLPPAEVAARAKANAVDVWALTDHDEISGVVAARSAAEELGMRYVAGVEISVSDTGIGMDEEVRTRCLDPFYSTKEKPGTGLGLPMVHGIIRRHAGQLQIDSAPGAGSTFRVLLPRDNAATQAAHATQPATNSRTLRVLLAEDDERLRELIALQMESMGHIVETAADGNEALDLFHKSPFDLILTDLSMPRLNGIALVEAARQIIAEIPVIMLTGFGAMLLPDGERPPGVDILLTKPITRDNLAAAIARVAP